jgi:hypothetical protein
MPLFCVTYGDGSSNIVELQACVPVDGGWLVTYPEGDSAFDPKDAELVNIEPVSE